MDFIQVIAFRYLIFALISTAINLLFQYFSFMLYSGFGKLYVAMLVGTIAGLLVKYVLDKKYIFFHTPDNKRDDAKKFMLYSFMGVFTTFIFWGTEILFHQLYPQNPQAKYIGAIIGLSIGYVVKYFLDKRFVFVHAHEAEG